MQKSNRLRLSLPPVPRESLLSLCWRVAQRNLLSLESAFQMGGVSGGPKNHLNPADSLKLDSLFKFSPGTVGAHSTWVAAGGRTASINGVQIRKTLLRLETRAICPACMAGSMAQPAVWLLGPLRTCPAHRVPLIDACPECAAPLAWKGANPSQCAKCGGVLAGTSMEPTEEGVASAKAIMGMYGEPEYAAHADTLLGRSPFRELGPDAVLALLDALADVAAPLPSLRERVLGPVTRPAVCLDQALEACVRFPEGLHELVASSGLDRYPEFGGGSLWETHYWNAKLRPLENWAKGLKNGGAAELLTILAPHARRCGVYLYRAPRAGTAWRARPTSDLNMTQVMTGKQVIERLGLRPGLPAECFHALAAARVDSGYFLASGIDSLAAKVTRVVTSREATRMLNVCIQTLEALVYMGLLAEVGGHQDLHTDGWLLDGAEIEAFIERFRPSAMGTIPASRGIQLANNGTKRATIKGIEAAVVFKEVLDGRLPCMLIDDAAQGIARYVFAPDDVREILRSAQVSLRRR